MQRGSVQMHVHADKEQKQGKTQHDRALVHVSAIVPSHSHISQALHKPLLISVKCHPIRLPASPTVSFKNTVSSRPPYLIGVPHMPANGAYDATCLTTGVIEKNGHIVSTAAKCIGQHQTSPSSTVPPPSSPSTLAAAKQAETKPHQWTTPAGNRAELGEHPPLYHRGSWNCEVRAQPAALQQTLCRCCRLRR